MTFRTVSERHKKEHLQARHRERSVSDWPYMMDFLSGVTVDSAAGPVPFADKPFADVTHADIETVLAAKARKDEKVIVLTDGRRFTRTVGGEVARNRLLTYLKSVWNWAIDEEITARSPFPKKRSLRFDMLPETRATGA